jgi:hypothetical protein
LDVASGQLVEYPHPWQQVILTSKTSEAANDIGSPGDRSFNLSEVGRAMEFALDLVLALALLRHSPSHVEMVYRRGDDPHSLLETTDGVMLLAMDTALEDPSFYG